MKMINRSRLQSLMQREQKKFVEERPKSKALFERARRSLVAHDPELKGILAALRAALHEHVGRLRRTAAEQMGSTSGMRRERRSA